MDEKTVITEAVEEKLPSMDDFKEELEASFKRVKTGDILKATIVSVDELEGAVADLNYYAPGKIAVDEFSDDPKFAIMEEVHPGDVVDAIVLRPDDGAGNIVLSVKQAGQELAWDKFAAYEKEKKTLNVQIKEAVNGGVICYPEGIRAFIPASKLSLTYVEDLKTFVGKKVEARVINVDAENKKLVLSCKEILAEQAHKEKEEMIERIAVGSIVNGTVESLQNYGAFVNIGDGVSGLLHISQISNKRLGHPKEALKEGQEVRVKIIKVEKGKVSLSMKEAETVLDKDIDTKAPVEYSDNGSASTSLGSLFKNIKLN